MLAVWMLHLPGFLLFGLISLGGKRRKIGWRYALLALVAGLVLFAVACGDGNTTKTVTPQSGTTAGTYTVLVTASSGSLSHNLPLTLTVQ